MEASRSSPDSRARRGSHALINSLVAVEWPVEGNDYSFYWHVAVVRGTVEARSQWADPAATTDGDAGEPTAGSALFLSLLGPRSLVFDL